MDIYSAIYPVLWSSRVLGLAPISMKRGSKVHQPQSSIKILLYSVFMAAVTMTLSVCNIVSHKYEYYFKSGPTIVFNIQEYADTLLTAAFVFLSCSNHRNIISFVSNIDYVDRSLLSLGVTVSFKLLTSLFRTQILLAITFILLPFLFISYYWVINNMSILTTVAACIFILRKITTFWMHLQFLDYMLLIRQRIQIINTKILETKTDEREHYFLNSDSFIPSVRESLSSGINDINLTQNLRAQTNSLISVAVSALEDTRNSVAGDVPCRTNTCQQNSKVEFTGQLEVMSSSDSKVLAGPFHKRSRMTRVRLLAHLHDLLCDTAEVLNSIFSVQILLYSALCFVDITVNLYCFFVLFRLANRTSHNTHYMYGSLYVCLLNAIQIIGIVAACAFTAEEVSFVFSLFAFRFLFVFPTPIENHTD
jgi:hypothetical protein